MFVEHCKETNRQPSYPAACADGMLMSLCPADQAEYMRLVNFFQFANDRNKRYLGMSTFLKHLTMIHQFVYRGDAYDSYRGIVCGIEFGVNSLLINTGRLKKLMNRSKSCMNGCFQRLGYNVCRPSHDVTTLFLQILPGCSPSLFTARQWCVRKLSEGSQVCFMPNINIDIVGQTISQPQTPSSPRSPVEISTKVDRISNMEQKETPFLFDIRELLNVHGAYDIRRMSQCEVPPLCC